ncbi:MAG: hypothetical protein QOG30_1121 [Acidimicrobiaceae bacterium]
MTHDLVIRGGDLIDGSGAPRRRADVAIDGGQITAVGKVASKGRDEIDADGLIVAPGFVDIHTHYDGQVTWDPYLSPSSSHGVTTVVMGNCGIGFAPMHPASREWAYQLVDGVEDIPQASLAEGIRWDWESYPEYLDAVARSPLAIDVGSMVPHGAVRVYVMGDRGSDHVEAATEDEIAAMGALVAEGLAAGALGVSTSRTKNQRGRDGRITPTFSACRDELLGISQPLKDAGRGVLQIVADGIDSEEEFALFEEVAAATGRPLSLAVVTVNEDPALHRRVLQRISEANADRLPITAQVAVRPIGFLLGFDGTLHPFVNRPSYAAIAHLGHAERVARLRDPATRQRILAEGSVDRGLMGYVATAWEHMFVLGDPPDYEPPPERSVAAIAAQQGVDPDEVAYDLLLQRDGTEILYVPALNYAGGDLDETRAMLLAPEAVVGLSDAGAHCGYICDASSPTFLLTHWARDRSRGERLPLEFVVRAQTRRPAELIGLTDRGLIAPGMKADINVIDFDELRLLAPQVVHDLPAGGRRLVQSATGYRQTIVSGTVVFDDAEPTGQLPGRLVRGGRLTG